MPRPFTAGERTILGSPLITTHARVKLEDPDGAMRDVTNWFATNWFVSAAWDEKLDRQVASGQLVLGASNGSESMAPAIGASLINRNGLGSYAPFLAVGRRLTIETAVTLPGVAPVASDWKERVTGYTDRVNIAPDARHVTVVFRDLGARLADAQIRGPITVGLAGGTPMETAMQALIDAVLPAGHGVVLYTPVSPGMGVWPYELPAGGNLLEALNALARKAGAVVSYRYDAAGVSRLTLWIPPRTKTVPDATIGPIEYFVLPQFDTTIDDVRNVVRVEYFDVALGTRSFQQYTNAASVAAIRHERFMKIEEADGSPVRTDAQALALATAAGSDLGAPPTEQQVSLRHWWPAQIADLYAFTANGTHYDSDQKLAITGIRTSLEPAGERTVLETRGSVAGAFKSWHSPTGPTPEPLPDLPVARLLETASDANSVTFEANGSAGSGVLGGLEWQYIVWRDKLDPVPAWPGTWLAAPTYALPYSLVMAKAPARDQYVRVRVRDVGGRISEPVQRTIPAQIPSIDDAGAPKRSAPYDDGGYGTRATDSGGLQLHVDVAESGLKPVRRLLAKPLAADPDTFDSVPDGTTYRRTTLNEKTGAGRGYATIDASNRVKRGNGFDDGGYAAITTDAAGTLLHVEMRESGAKPVNRLYAKTLPADPDNADSLAAGLSRTTTSLNYVNTSGVVVSMYDYTIDEAVTANLANIGRRRAIGAIANEAGLLTTGAKESQGKPVNRLFAKTLAADVDTADSLPNGVTRAAVSISHLDASNRPKSLVRAAGDSSVTGDQLVAGLAASPENLVTNGSGELDAIGAAASGYTYGGGGVQGIVSNDLASPVGDRHIKYAHGGVAYNSYGYKTFYGAVPVGAVFEVSCRVYTSDIVGAGGLSGVLVHGSDSDPGAWEVLGTTGDPDGDQTAFPTAARGITQGSSNAWLQYRTLIRAKRAQTALYLYHTHGFYNTVQGTARIRDIIVRMLDPNTAVGGARGKKGLADSGEVALNLPAFLGQHDGVSVRVLAKGHVSGSCRHGDVVNFPTNFQNVPMVLIRGGITYEPRAKWGLTGDGTETGASNYTTAAHREDVAALNLTASGFTMRARLRQRATPTLREHYFPANSLTAVGHYVERNLDNAPANNDTYTVLFSVALTANAGVGAPNTATLTVAIEVNSGSGYFERATRTYAVQAPVGASNSTSWLREAVSVVVSGLDATDDIQIKVKSFSAANGGSFTVHGFASGDSEYGVTYQTGADTYASKTPEADDRVYWEAIEVA